MMILLVLFNHNPKMSHTQSKLTQTPGLYIIQDRVRGRGVACVNMIEKDSTIEICPVILLSTEDTEAIHLTHLHNHGDTVVVPREIWLVD